MKSYNHLICAIILIFSSCTDSEQIDIQGHRGARGLAPENSIPAFMKALELGVTTLEMDVVISADSLVVVSHEPWVSRHICLGSNGQIIPEEEERTRYNMFRMTYEEIESCDCGSLVNDRFPDQILMPVKKPLLSDVISSVETMIEETGGYKVFYNIEIKSSEEGDNLFHPEIALFSELVYETVSNNLAWERVTIQSFDFRVLNHWNANYPDVSMVALVANELNAKSNISNLGFKPAVYSPYFEMLNLEDVNWLHSEGIKVVPWTVNEKTQMETLVEMGVDGIITDYPNRAAELGLTMEVPSKN